MRLTRRGMFAGQGSGAKFIWAVYSLTYGADESTTPYTGSFTITQNGRYRMTAKDYTATSTTFTLTDPVQTNRDALKIGDYFVSTSTLANSSTSGDYLYKITGISESTIYYTRWAPTLCRKGSEYLYDVSAKEMLYPFNGMQGGYWYVMVKGEVTMYVWDIYNAVFVYGYKEKSDGVGNYSIGADGNVRYGNAYTFDKATGFFTITNPTTITYATATANPTILSNKYFYGRASGNTDMYYNATGYISAGSSFTGTSRRSRTQDTSYIVSASRGTATGRTAEAVARNAYPDNNYVGDFWYVYSHSYLYQT